MYMRYEHKVGIDIDIEDSSIYKHPASYQPDVIHIIKLCDEKSTASMFQKSYETQLRPHQYHYSSRKRRLSF